MSERTIEVTVKFFAAPREALGRQELTQTVPAGTTVGQLLERLVEAHPVLQAHTRFVNAAVNRAYVGMQTELHDGDEVAYLPPVGGG
jgi:molybdopterin converting factor subunit 1